MAKFIFSPVEYYRQVLLSDVRMVAAAVPVCIYVVGSVAVPVITTWRGQAVITDLPEHVGGGMQVIAVLFAAVTAAVFTVFLLVGSVLAIAVLFAQADYRRLIECCALAYWSQAPWVIGHGVVLVAWDVGFQEVGMTTSAVEQYVRTIEQSPIMLTLRLVTAYFGLWLVALQVCALRVVSGFTVRGAWAAGVVLGLVFVVVPWAAQRFF